MAIIHEYAILLYLDLATTEIHKKRKQLNNFKLTLMW